MTKTYQLKNVAYTSGGRRWTFTAPNFTYATPYMPGGRPTADKVARIINGAVKRCGTMDNLARSNMATVFHQAAKVVSQTVNH